jgi:hypothetical protein
MQQAKPKRLALSFSLFSRFISPVKYAEFRAIARHDQVGFETGSNPLTLNYRYVTPDRLSVEGSSSGILSRVVIKRLGSPILSQ